MAIVDADYKFIMVDIGAAGRDSDGGVFANSLMYEYFNDETMQVPQPEKVKHDEEPFFSDQVLPYVLLGDEAFGFSEFLMRPFPRHTELILRKRVFNYRLSRARRIVECAFGILSAVWRIFRRPLLTNLINSKNIVKCCVTLHNFILMFDPLREKTYKLKHTPDAYENCFTELPLNEMPIEQQGPIKMREDFTDYFMTRGNIKFQWDKAIDANF